MNVTDFQIPKSAVHVKQRFIDNGNGVTTDIGIKVQEKRYERLIILSKDEFEYIVNVIAPQILEKKPGQEVRR